MKRPIALWIFVVGMFIIPAHPVFAETNEHNSPEVGEGNNIKYFIVSYKGNRTQEIAEYTKVIESNPYDNDAYFKRGMVYFAAGNLSQAVSDFTKTIEIKPNDIKAYKARGATYAFMGDLDQAIVNYNKAIEMDPQDADTYEIRGVTYLDKGDFIEALDDYNRAIGINPNLAAAYNGRAMVYFYKQEYGKSREDVRKAEELGYSIDKNFFRKLDKYSKIKGKSVENIDLSDRGIKRYTYDNLPQICFFPPDKAHWDGYRVLPKDWENFTLEQRKRFVIEAIKEIKQERGATVKYENINELVKTLDTLAHLMALGSEKKPVVTILFSYLFKGNFLEYSPQDGGAMSNEKEILDDSIVEEEVDMGKVYCGYIVCYEKDDTWVTIPPVVDDIQSGIIYAKYKPFLNGNVILSGKYTSFSKYKINSFKEINSSRDRIGQKVHYYEIIFEVIS